MSLNYTVIASGSSGNAVQIEDVLVDIGIPFKQLKRYLYDINYIIITHIHTDHLNITTFKKIRQLFPDITIIGNWQVAQKVDIDIIANAGFTVTVDDREFYPFELVHDVVCYGYTWLSQEGENIIYATDTNNLDNAPDEKYDYLFIESNHDVKKIAQTKPTRGYDPKLSAMRHLSTFDSKQFYFTHRNSKDSEWIELHKSARFY